MYNCKKYYVTRFTAHIYLEWCQFYEQIKNNIFFQNQIKNNLNVKDSTNPRVKIRLMESVVCRI